jgi:DNA polymerase IV
MERAILHCDLNHFYAAVECLYRPELRDSPVAVCGDVDQRHGIVLAKNMLAKRAGIITGEAVWQARRKCPRLVVVQPTYGLYIRFSRMAREIYTRYTPYIESFGIDECWLDVTCAVKSGPMGAVEIAQDIRRTMREELGITVSVGVAWNKIFAKLGSDMKKPDAVTVITREDFRQSVWPLPANDLLYVGRATWRKFQSAGIYTIGGIALTPLHVLRSMLGKWGETLHLFANGMDASPVTPMDWEEQVKGVGNSVTTPRDICDEQDARQVFFALAESVAERMRKKGFLGTVLQIWVRDTGLESFTRQRVLSRPTCLASDMAAGAMELFCRHWRWDKPLRSLGLRMSGLHTQGDGRQLALFPLPEDRMEALERSIDGIRQRFGHGAIKRAMMLRDSALSPDPGKEDSPNRVAFMR